MNENAEKFKSLENYLLQVESARADNADMAPASIQKGAGAMRSQLLDLQKALLEIDQVTSATMKALSGPGGTGPRQEEPGRQFDEGQPLLEMVAELRAMAGSLVVRTSKTHHMLNE